VSTRANTPARSDVLLILRTPPPYGGGEMICRQLEECFAGRYSILAFRRPGHDRASQGRFTVSNVAFAARFVFRSSLRLLANRPRVLYVDVPKDGPSFVRTSLILLTALALRIRIVGDLAGADFQFLHDRSALSRYGRWVLPRLARIRVLGEAIAVTLHAHGLDNTVIVSNGIAEPPDAPADGRGSDGWSCSPTFLYVGKIAEAKGIFTLLGYVQSARASGTPVHLHVVGEWADEHLRERVLEVVAREGLTESVEFHGLLVDDEKWRLFRSSQALLHPTSWDGQPVTILEALAFGLPVVSTTVGAIPDTIRSGVEGYLMADNTVEELAAGVATVMRDADTYAKFSRRARRAFVERFTVERFETAMAELLEGEAKERPR
jgi:glycosyltransferase involved in cell wall biosynthesis